MLVLILALLVTPVLGEDLQITPVGDYKIVVDKPPVLLSAQPGYDLYFWSGPDSLKIKGEMHLCEIAGPKGEHTVKCTAISWVIDWQKKTKEVVQKTATMTFIIGDTSVVDDPDDVVVVVDDDDTPSPPDIKPGSRFIVVIDEVQDRTVARSVLISDLRKHIDKTAHTLIVLDKDSADPGRLKPYLDRAADKNLPYWFIVTDTGALVHEGFVPAGLTEAKAEIEEHAK